MTAPSYFQKKAISQHELYIYVYKYTYNINTIYFKFFEMVL